MGVQEQVRYVALSNAHLGKFGSREENNGLKETLEGFGVDFEEPVFARVAGIEERKGLTPMKRFMIG